MPKLIHGPSIRPSSSDGSSTMTRRPTRLMLELLQREQYEARPNLPTQLMLDTIRHKLSEAQSGQPTRLARASGKLARTHTMNLPR